MLMEEKIDEQLRQYRSINVNSKKQRILIETEIEKRRMEAKKIVDLNE